MGPQGTGGLCLRGDPDILPWKVGGTGVQTFSERQPEQLPVRLEAERSTATASPDWTRRWTSSR